MLRNCASQVHAFLLHDLKETYKQHTFFLKSSFASEFNHQTTPTWRLVLPFLSWFWAKRDLNICQFKNTEGRIWHKHTEKFSYQGLSLGSLIINSITELR